MTPQAQDGSGTIVAVSSPAPEEELEELLEEDVDALEDELAEDEPELDDELDEEFEEEFDELEEDVEVPPQPAIATAINSAKAPKVRQCEFH